MSAGEPTTPAQLALELALRPAFEAEDYFVSASNRSAVDLVDQWPHWPHHAAVVVAPPGSGKSHLANVWRLRSGAAVTPASAVSDETVGILEATRALAVEDIDAGIADERVLFHILNTARETKGTVLMTSAVPPGEIAIGLPDLRSRVRALPVVTMERPDDALLRAVLVKLFSDRQLTVEPHVISYMALHLDRSLEAAQRAVHRVDRMALERQRRVTRAMAQEAVAALASSGGD